MIDAFGDNPLQKPHVFILKFKKYVNILKNKDALEKIFSTVLNNGKQFLQKWKMNITKG